MRGKHERKELGAIQHLFAGFMAGAITATFTNPIWARSAVVYVCDQSP